MIVSTYEGTMRPLQPIRSRFLSQETVKSFSAAELERELTIAAMDPRRRSHRFDVLVSERRRRRSRS